MPGKTGGAGLSKAQQSDAPRLPTAVLSTGIMRLAFLSFACGMILDNVARGRREAKRMNYLNRPVFQPRIHMLLEKRLAG